ncbi:hypothetical protein GDO86_001393 [Hymenochirus boettgeri]|uniref:Ig-like domain-containing protein n=1 Tax=Hymenochirus boettgeri TaxID=247094 RepID=A0A8T2KI27_9PIPI|nr:hypothetical protein GDO86_001393 [Hymenochirus boettgeri]
MPAGEYLLCIFFMWFPTFTFLFVALFVVTVQQSTYTAQYGDKVHLICIFPVGEDIKNLQKLKMSWEHLDTSQEVLILNNGKLDLTHQADTFKGRATLLMDVLNTGQAVLEIRNLKLSDSGKYRCVLQLDASDHKTINLEVQASYKIIYIYSHSSPADNEDFLTCQSLGFPLAEVYWQNNGGNITLPATTSHILTSDGLYNTTSTIKYRPDIKQNYSCVFWNKALKQKTQVFFGYQELKDNQVAESHFHAMIIISIFISLLVMMLVVCIKRKGCFKCFRKKGKDFHHKRAIVRMSGHTMI